jgi:hypothetical protein
MYPNSCLGYEKWTSLAFWCQNLKNKLLFKVDGNQNYFIWDVKHFLSSHNILTIKNLNKYLITRNITGSLLSIDLEFFVKMLLM